MIYNFKTVQEAKRGVTSRTHCQRTHTLTQLIQCHGNHVQRVSTISDAIRLLMLRVADEQRLPFEVKVPNATTRKAIAELESGKGKKFGCVDDLMADLHADD